MSLKPVFLVAAVIGLAGCQANEGSVEQFINQTHLHAVAQVEPLDEQAVFVAEKFVMSRDRVPFLLPQPEVGGIAQGEGRACWQPSARKHTSSLENYALEQLSMRGVIGGPSNKEWALIYTPQGALVRVQEGSYIGRNHGRVLEIMPDKVAIEEIMPDGDGCWLRIPATLKLASK